MKTIKWSLFTLVFAVFMGAFISCSSDSNGDPAAKLSADPTHIDLSAGKDSKTVIITASEGKWNATRPEADSWCSLAAVDNKLTIAAEANGSDRERTTKVTVTSGNATPIVINVVQKSTILVGLPDTVILKVHGKEQAFTVLTEEKITLSTPDPAVWCTVIITYNNIAFSAPLNNGVRRETIANITAGGETKSVVVIQEAKGEGNYAIGDVYKVDGKAIGVVGWVNEYGNTFLVSLDEMADTET
ncbi:MAG: BACON domain-containing protein, partial [Odoribacter sp.]